MRKSACPHLIAPPAYDAPSVGSTHYDYGGTERCHSTATETGGRDDTLLDVGMPIDIIDHRHLLFSAGRSIDGPTDFQLYIAYQFTFGSEYFGKR